MKILVIDDEKNVRRILKDYLENEGYDVVLAEDGEAGIEKAMNEKALDLILLDVRMPGLSGFEVIGTIKEYSHAPVIFLTALDESFDEIKGLDLGADDYMTKPFNYKVLMARIKSCIRKNKKETTELLTYQEMSIDTKNRMVRMNGQYIELAHKEYDLLLYLYTNRDINVDRFQILNQVWGYDYDGDPRTVDTHVKNIRAKLKTIGHSIKTVRGVGYRFETKTI